MQAPKTLKGQLTGRSNGCHSDEGYQNQKEFEIHVDPTKVVKE